MISYNFNVNMIDNYRKQLDLLKVLYLKEIYVSAVRM